MNPQLDAIQKINTCSRGTGRTTWQCIRAVLQAHNGDKVTFIAGKFRKRVITEILKSNYLSSMITQYVSPYININLDNIEVLTLDEFIARQKEIMKRKKTSLIFDHEVDWSLR